jgi:hypothetical protein
MIRGNRKPEGAVQRPMDSDFSGKNSLWIRKPIMNGGAANHQGDKGDSRKYKHQ